MASSRDRDIKRLMARIRKSEELTKNNKSFFFGGFFSVNSVLPDAGLILDPKLAPPDDTQAKLLRQIVLAELGDHVVR